MEKDPLPGYMVGKDGKPKAVFDADSKSLDGGWREIVVFNDEYFPGWRSWGPVHMSNAMAGEFGEVLLLLGGHIGNLCNLTKKIEGGGTSERKDEELIEKAREETVDIFIYLVLAAEIFGMDVDTFITEFNLKMDENRRRMEKRKVGK